MPRIRILPDHVANQIAAALLPVSPASQAWTPASHHKPADGYIAGSGMNRIRILPDHVANQIAACAWWSAPPR